MIPQSIAGGSSSANLLPRLNGSGKLAGSFGGGVNELALLDGAGRIPAGAAPAKAVYATGGGQALVPGDIGAEATSAKNANSGYCGLDGAGRVGATQAPTKALYATGGAQALVPGDIGAQATSEKNNANGYAGLDGTGKVPSSQLPDAIVGALKYKGTRDAGSAAPSSPAKGDYWVVNVAGSTSLSGITDWQIGDWAVYDGAAWGKIDNTDAVTSIFGRSGTVTAQSGDYSVGQVTGAEATANKGAANGYASLDGGTRLPAAQLPTTAIVAGGSVAMTGSLKTAGVREATLAAKVTDYTLAATDEVVPFDCAGGTPGQRVAQLPPATGSGTRYRICKEDSSAPAVRITADATNADGGADLINGAATYDLLVQYEAVTLIDIKANAWRLFA